MCQCRLVALTANVAVNWNDSGLFHVKCVCSKGYAKMVAWSMLAVRPPGMSWS